MGDPLNWGISEETFGAVVIAVSPGAEALVRERVGTAFQSEDPQGLWRLIAANQKALLDRLLWEADKLTVIEPGRVREAIQESARGLRILADDHWPTACRGERSHRPRGDREDLDRCAFEIKQVTRYAPDPPQLDPRAARGALVQALCLALAEWVLGEGTASDGWRVPPLGEAESMSDLKASLDEAERPVSRGEWIRDHEQMLTNMGGAAGVDRDTVVELLTSLNEALTSTKHPGEASAVLQLLGRGDLLGAPGRKERFPADLATRLVRAWVRCEVLRWRLQRVERLEQQRQALAQSAAAIPGALKPGDAVRLGYNSKDIDDLQDRLCHALGFRIEVERPELLPEVAAMSAGDPDSWLWHTLTYKDGVNEVELVARA